MDKPKAVAAAHKLAKLIYTMLTKGEEYSDHGQAYYKARYRERELRNLSERAKKMGLKVLPAEQAACESLRRSTTWQVFLERGLAFRAYLRAMPILRTERCRCTRVAIA